MVMRVLSVCQRRRKYTVYFGRHRGVEMKVLGVYLRIRCYVYSGRHRAVEVRAPGVLCAVRGVHLSLIEAKCTKLHMF